MKGRKNAGKKDEIIVGACTVVVFGFLLTLCFANKQIPITRCIQELVSNKTVVQIELYGSNTVDVEGTIIRWETKEIEVALIENGNNAGVARISPDAITRIAWDS